MGIGDRHPATPPPLPPFHWKLLHLFDKTSRLFRCSFARSSAHFPARLLICPLVGSFARSLAHLPACLLICLLVCLLIQSLACSFTHLPTFCSFSCSFAHLHASSLIYSLIRSFSCLIAHFCWLVCSFARLFAHLLAHLPTRIVLKDATSLFESTVVVIHSLCSVLSKSIVKLLHLFNASISMSYLSQISDENVPESGFENLMQMDNTTSDRLLICLFPSSWKSGFCPF